MPFEREEWGRTVALSLDGTLEIYWNSFIRKVFSQTTTTCALSEQKKSCESLRAFKFVLTTSNKLKIEMSLGRFELGGGEINFKTARIHEISSVTQFWCKQKPWKSVMSSLYQVNGSNLARSYVLFLGSVFSTSLIIFRRVRRKSLNFSNIFQS
jgi:hypothetical protein